MDNFNDHIEKVKKSKDHSEKVIMFSGVTNSDDFNNNFIFIQDTLNDLYEKTRLIQDISNYTKSFLKNQVISQKYELYDLLKTTEKTRDSFKKDGYITRTVSFAPDLSRKCIDRDKTEVSPASVIDQKITLLGKEEKIVKIKTMLIGREAPMFSSNEGDVLNGEPLRNFYMLDGPATNGVSETYNLEFENQSYVTSAHIENVNADITEVKLMLPMGRPMTVTDQAATGFKKQLADSLSFTITDKSYRQVTYEYDATRMSSDFWHKIGKKEYAAEMGLEYSFDLDSESGMKKYREDYAAYQAAVAAWNAEKQAVEDRNNSAMSQYDSSYSSWSSTVSSISSSYESVINDWISRGGG